MTRLADISHHLRAAAAALATEKQMDGTLGEVVEDIAHALLVLRDLDAAEPLVEQALRVRPRSGRAMHCAVSLALQRGRLEEALALAVEGVRLHPGDRLFAMRRAKALQRLGRDAEASDVLSVRLASAPADVSARMELAASERRLHRFETADRHCKVILNTRPRHRGALLALVRSALDRCDAELALGRAEAAHAALPDDLEILERLSQVQSGAGRHAEAASSLRALCERRPDETGPKLQLVQAETAAGNVPAASAMLDKVLVVEPSNRAALAARLEIALTAQDLETASRLAAEVASGFPEDPRLVHKAAIAWRRAGNSEAAAAMLRQCLSVHECATALKVELGRCLLLQGAHDEASMIFDAILQQSPDNAGARLGLADAHDAAGKSALALKILEEGLFRPESARHE